MDWLIVVATRIKHAVDNLVSAGFVVYAPRYRERRGSRWYDRFLFGRYLLVKRLGKWATQFHQLVRTSGVRSVLRFKDERPLLVRAAEVERIKSRENKRGYIPQPPRFKPNQKVRITRGAFADQLARFIGEDGIRDKIELEFLGRVMSLSLPEGSLISA